METQHSRFDFRTRVRMSHTFVPRFSFIIAPKVRRKLCGLNSHAALEGDGLIRVRIRVRVSRAQPSCQLPCRSLFANDVCMVAVENLLARVF